MEWMKAIGDAVDYIETHILEDIDTDTVARHVCISPFYFQKGFSMLCGYTVTEYIRSRRLALASVELMAGNVKIIDLALKYGYDSPDSFTRAFTRFHGITPSMARKEGVMLKSFAPLKLTISLKGGYMMDYRITRKESFTVLGFSRTFDYENASRDIPAFWQEHYAQGRNRYAGGMYGVNIDCFMGHENFEYLIADLYNPAMDIPEGFVVKTIPAFTWAVFPCIGPMPDTGRDLNGRIFSEWLPALKEYEFAAGYCIEMYDSPDKYPEGTSDVNYRMEIWIPITKKEN